MKNATNKQHDPRRGSRLRHVIAWSVMGIATASFAAPGMKLPTMTEAERAELLSTAVNASSPRIARAEERALLLMSRDEARTLLAQEKMSNKSSAATSGVRSMRSETKGAMVVGNALLSNSRVTLGKDGKHLHSCATGEHVHDAATQTRIDALAKSAQQANGGARE
jgi:hypothetical protein